MSEECQSRQIARMILRVRYGIASDREKQALEAWLQGGEERRQIYERILSGQSWKEYAHLKDSIDAVTDYGQLQSDILHSIRMRNRHHVRRRYLLWGGSVAAVVLVAVWVFARFADVWQGQPQPALVQVVPEESLESSDKVVLVLADGKRIGMSSIADDSFQVGEHAVGRMEEGRLVYETARVSPDEEVLEMNQVITSTGGFYSLVLSDGTRIWLNSESKLEYPVAFGNGERKVRLDGEAFFEVARDESRPFYVVVGDVQTRVLGTSFNIKAYADESNVLTTLFTGRVEVASLKGEGQKVVLQPGRQAAWNKQTGEMETAEVDLERVGAWKEGMFYFDGENIAAVTRQIERWYDVHFVYQLAGIENYTFNGYFDRNEPLETLLEEFSYMGNLKFKIDKDTVYVTRK